MAQPAGVTRVSSDGQIRLMTKVAHLYHERRLRQSEIATLLHISQAKVSRLLKRAGEVGIVRTVVVVSQGVHTDAGTGARGALRLLEAVVVDVDGDEAAISAGLGSAGAAYLEATLAGGERIGVSSWSQTLLSVVDRLRPLRTPGADAVVQLVGGVGVAPVQAQANRLLEELAALIGAGPVYVPAPGWWAVPTMRRSLLADPAMEGVAGQWQDLTMALVGIGSLQPSPLLQASGNAIDPADQDTLLARWGRSATSAPVLRRGRAPGRTATWTPAWSASTRNVYRRIPRRIGLAGGERKHAAIRAAIAGYWVNVLVTDLSTARALLAAS